MTEPGRERLDKLLTARGLAATRERAQMLIRAGAVTVDGAVAARPSLLIDPSASVEVAEDPLPYVGRGGLKLEAALRYYRLNVAGMRCVDIGASTGGFTDCLLQRGAAHVTAIDVGHGQLAEALRSDARVELREGVNARYLQPSDFSSAFDLAVIDVSFISATLVLPAVVPLVRQGGHAMVLVKPEFEAGREAVNERGVVRDPEARRGAIERVCACGVSELGLFKKGVIPCPVRTGGNREYWAYFRLPDGSAS